MYVSITHIFIIILCMKNGFANFDLSALRKFISKYVEDQGQTTVTSKEKSYSECDENKLMTHLAELYVVSPERIVLLLTLYSFNDICNKISRVISETNYESKECVPLNKKNIYVRLLNGLKKFQSNICDDLPSDEIRSNQQCLHELYEEYIDCEGPGDWFEWKNNSLVCQCFVDIINCNYIKTSELCGLDVAFAIRRLIADVFKNVLPFPCQLPKSLPKVGNPMNKNLNDRFSNQVMVWYKLISIILLVHNLLIY